MKGEGVMSEELLTDDQSHYEVSLTAGQAFIAFVLTEYDRPSGGMLLLLGLGLLTAYVANVLRMVVIVLIGYYTDTAETDLQNMLVAHSYGSVGPTGVVPTRDQTVSPLAHRLGKAIPRLARHGAKRVSVKVSQSRRQIELLSDGCQRIFDVEPQELFPAVQPHERSTASRSRSEAAANGPQVGERRLEERST